jgi:hypothetical protein
MADKIRITILAGGLVKIETDKVSGPNHTSADRLVRGIEQDLGGETQVEKKALSRNLYECPFYEAFLKATNPVLVATMRCAFRSR